MNNPLVCPHGGHSDKIDKVSFIYKSQTRTRETTEWVYETYRDERGNEQSFSYPRSYDVIEITNLAKQLTPPSRPQDPSTVGLGVAIIITIPIIGLFFLPVLSSLSPSLSSLNDILKAFGAAVICSFIPLAVLGFAFFSYFKKKRQAQAMLPHWKRAIAKWNQLYYCAQHDIIFNPYNEDGSTIPVSQMTRYLYS